MPEIVSDTAYPNGPANIYGDTYIEGIFFIQQVKLLMPFILMEVPIQVMVLH